MRTNLIGVLLAAVVLAALHAGTATGAEQTQLPNLVALPPFDIQIGEADRESPNDAGPAAIRFATGAANRSDYALELLGRPSSASEAVAQQCVAWAAPRTCSQHKDVGTFAWHPEHGHYHFQDFALYELRRLRHDGQPIMRKRGLVATSGKISYCIIDYEQEESRGPLYAVAYPLYYSCAAGLGAQGISPGWKDIYTEETVGQQIPLVGIPDGEYALIVIIDPAQRLAEIKEDDNRALARVKLFHRGGSIEVVCIQAPGEECVAEDSPES